MRVRGTPPKKIKTKTKHGERGSEGTALSLRGARRRLVAVLGGFRRLLRLPELQRGGHPEPTGGSGEREARAHLGLHRGGLKLVNSAQSGRAVVSALL